MEHDAEGPGADLDDNDDKHRRDVQEKAGTATEEPGHRGERHISVCALAKRFIVTFLTVKTAAVLTNMNLAADLTAAAQHSVLRPTSTSLTNIVGFL